MFKKLRTKVQSGFGAKRTILMGIGSVFVGLGLLGILLPVLPTTPFLLIASACYFKSSEKCYWRLLSNRFCGHILRGYREGRGIPIRTKLFAISMIWLSIPLSIRYVISSVLIKVLISVIAMVVTVYLILIKAKDDISNDVIFKADE
ncbi:MAG TPA: DUF454 domain-containing protein [Clostridiales bacterium]|nr:DUF454 domain-containing protein [Clostridiales bacterium]